MSVTETSSGGGLQYEVGFGFLLDEQTEMSDEDVERAEASIRAILEEWAAEVLDVARTVVPIRTGRLLASLQYEVDDAALLVTFSSAVPYASFVEKGTSRMSAEPFFLPAILASIGEVQARFDETMAASVSESDGDVEGDEMELEIDDVELGMDFGL